MSQREVDRLGVIREVAGKRLRQAAAADLLGLSVRQVKRLAKRYRARGAAGLVIEDGARTTPSRRQPPARARVRADYDVGNRKENWDLLAM